MSMENNEVDLIRVYNIDVPSGYRTVFAKLEDLGDGNYVAAERHFLLRDRAGYAALKADNKPMLPEDDKLKYCVCFTAGCQDRYLWFNDKESAIINMLELLAIVFQADFNGMVFSYSLDRWIDRLCYNHKSKKIADWLKQECMMVWTSRIISVEERYLDDEGFGLYLLHREQGGSLSVTVGTPTFTM